MNITAEQAARSHETKSDMMLGVSVLLMVLGSAFVAVRLWCRNLIKSTGRDDIASVLALVSVAEYVCNTHEANIRFTGLFDSLRYIGRCQ